MVQPGAGWTCAQNTWRRDEASCDAVEEQHANDGPGLAAAEVHTLDSDDDVNAQTSDSSGAVWRTAQYCCLRQAHVRVSSGPCVRAEAA